MVLYNEIWDKHQAAVHEAGHATVAAVLCWSDGKSETVQLQSSIDGTATIEIGMVRAWIQPSGTNDPKEETTWVGSTNYGYIRLDERDIATIHVAGIVAECLFGDVEIDADIIMAYWEAGVIEPSDTDWSGIPDSWSIRREAVAKALVVLRRYQDMCRKVVGHLVNHQTITDGGLKQYLALVT